MSKHVALGFIGFGEVGIALSRGLRKSPELSLNAYDIFWNEERRKIANDLCVRIVASLEELAAASDIIFCAVVPQAARQVAHSAVPFLGPQHLYVDLTSIGPAKVGEIQAAVTHNGSKFTKLALMGAVAAFGYRVPCVASGSGASDLAQALAPLGMDIKVLNDDPAAAATLKLCRSLFQKGFVALALEALRVAKKNGIEKEVIASLAETWDKEKFSDALNRLVCSSVAHAKRRSAELDEAIDAFGELDLELPVARACRGAFQELVDLQESNHFAKPPADLQQVLDALDK